MLNLISMIVLLLTGCGKDLSNSENRRTLVDSMNTFTFDVYRKMAETTKSGENQNIFCSPLGMSAVLGMAYGGAKGKTADEIEAVLHLGTLKEQAHPAFHDIIKDMTGGSDYTLYFANQVWLPDGTTISKQFIDLNQRYYSSVPQTINFASGNAGNTVDDWIAKETHGRIKNASVHGISELTNLLLTNVIYFKGTWVHQFDPAKTKYNVFYLLSGDKIEVPMMRQSKCTFQYIDCGESQILEMPYKGDTISMAIILPRRNIDFRKFENQLNWQQMNKWLNNMKETKHIDVQLPKFTFEENLDVGNVIQSLGVGEAFSTKANFSDITGSDNGFHLRGIKQKVYVRVDEAGTEAYAVTSGWSLGRGGPPPIQFFCDHPFVFLIRDMRSGAIIFIGRMMRPL